MAENEYLSRKAKYVNIYQISTTQHKSVVSDLIDNS